MLRVTECVAGKGVAQTDCRTDITRPNLIDILSMVGMHAQQTSNTLGLALRAILSSRTFGQHTRVDTHIRQATHEGVRDNLEDKRTEGRAIIDFTSDFLVCVWIDASWGRNIE